MRNSMRLSIIRPILFLALFGLHCCLNSVLADSLGQSRKVVSTTNAQLKKSQQKIDKLHDDTVSMLDQYKTAMQESESYTTYNRQLSEVVKSQMDELDSLNSQIDEIEITSRRIMPLMERMIDALEAFVDQDLPFLPYERSERLSGLRDNMVRADLSVAEKYRKILEAYQIEIEYGKTLEAYEGKIDDKHVNFLKLGRAAFFYQSLDGSSAAVWNKHKQAWQPVDDNDVRQSIALGMKIARKQHSPELLTILASKVEVLP